MNLSDYFSLIDPLKKLCKEVSVYICRCYKDSSFKESRRKSDGTPLTDVDLKAHLMLVKGLAAICPNIPVLSEESTISELDKRLEWTQLWIIDPLDGTREFLNETGDFTINLALVEDGRPVLGIIYQPLLDLCYLGLVGVGAWRLRSGDLPGGGLEIKAKSTTKKSISVLSSRSSAGLVFEKYFDWLKTRYFEVDLLKYGAAVKFIKLIEGVADIYPRFSACCEWDVAAGDALVHAAGGVLVGLDGLPLKYNARQTFISEPFVAVRDPNFSLLPQSIEFFSA